jgi:hypothetical protein
MLRIYRDEGKLRAEVSEDYPFETPIRFEVRHGITGDVVWDSELMCGHWSQYNYPDSSYPVARLISRSGVTLIEYKWNTMIDGDDIHKFFTLWAKNNPGSKGIAIGTHDGSSGEWVEPVRAGILEAYLVEASLKQYRDLVDNYRNVSNTYTLMTLVTADGGNYDFFEGENGYTNSVIPDITNRYQKDVKHVKMPSISITNLILNLKLENDLDWLHLDTEGLDADLLMSIDDSVVKLPKIIIFEVVNLSDADRDKCVKWLESKGYTCKGPVEFNMIAYKL